ncbi:MAG: hypothetical protein WCI88_02560 [Chloroflexota bacterium]
MFTTRKSVQSISLLIILYGLFLAPWMGVRTALEILIDLLSTINRGSVSSLRWILGSQFLALYIMALIASVILITNFRYDIPPKTSNILILISGLGGFILSIALIFQGARINGALICVLGFMGLIVIAYRNISEAFLERTTAISKLSNIWMKKLDEAKGQNIPLSILSIWVDHIPPVEEASQLAHSLRAHDEIFPVKDGYYLLLWDTNVTQAEKAAGYIKQSLQKLGKYGQIYTGISCFPLADDLIESLLKNANFALGIAKSAEKSNPVFYHETILSEDVAPLFLQMTNETMEFLLRLQTVWNESLKKNTPLGAIIFSVAGEKESQILMADLRSWLKGIDQVGMLTPGSVVAVLDDTDMNGCERLTIRLKEHFSKHKEKSEPFIENLQIKIIPLEKYRESFKEFILQLRNSSF